MATTQRIFGAGVGIEEKDRCASHDNRYSVTLAASFAALEGARKGDDDETYSREAVVYVKDKHLFSECVERKFGDTMEQWQEHRDFLEQE